MLRYLCCAIARDSYAAIKPMWKANCGPGCGRANSVVPNFAVNILSEGLSPNSAATNNAWSWNWMVDKYAEAGAFDQSRTNFLIAEGYRVLRFWNNEVVENIDGMLERISETLTLPSPKGRG
jgi:hypothetical protein